VYAQSLKDVKGATKRSRTVDRHVADSNESWLNYQGGTCRTAVSMMVHVPSRTSDLNFWSPPARLPYPQSFRSTSSSPSSLPNHGYVKDFESNAKDRIISQRDVRLLLVNVSLGGRKSENFIYRSWQIRRTYIALILNVFN